MGPRITPYSPLAMTAETQPFQVHQFLTFCNSLIGEVRVRVEGEVAGYSLSRGKFVFFDLKDEHEEARVGCFMMAHQLGVPIEDGMRVTVEGKPSLYVKSGQFRLTATRVEPVGQGSYKRAFELLCARLKDEGLFAPERKRPLPRYPQRVGIVSSSDAAGYGDFRKIALQRLPGVEFLFANVAVQGRDAEQEICRALDHLNGHYRLDAIVLIRGGGSLEDLHAFNSETVARSITRSKAPVLVGIGHERDVTVADYCADVRAATPSNAAQLLLPETEEVSRYVQRLTYDGRLRLTRSIESVRQRVESLQARAGDRLAYRIRAVADSVTHTLKSIETASPEQTLRRGYSITCTKDGEPVCSPQDVHPGTRIVTRVFTGTFHSTVE